MRFVGQYRKQYVLSVTVRFSLKPITWNAHFSDYIYNNPILGLTDEMDNVTITLTNLDESVKEFESAVTNLQSTISQFEADVTYKDMTFTQTVDLAIDLADDAVDYMDTTGRNVFELTFNNTLECDLIPVIDSYVDFAIQTVYQDLGACKPVKDIYDGFINTLCYKVRRFAIIAFSHLDFWSLIEGD